MFFSFIWNTSVVTFYISSQLQFVKSVQELDHLWSNISILCVRYASQKIDFLEFLKSKAIRNVRLIAVGLVNQMRVRIMKCYYMFNTQDNYIPIMPSFITMKSKLTSFYSEKRALLSRQIWFNLSSRKQTQDCLSNFKSHKKIGFAKTLKCHIFCFTLKQMYLLIIEVKINYWIY